MRIAVAREEALDAQRVGGMHAADQDRAAAGVLDHADAAQDERAQDDLADIGFGADHPAESGARYADRSARFRRARPDQHLALVEQVELAGELVRAVRGDDDLVAMRVGLHHRHRAVGQQEEVDPAIALAKQRVARRESLLAAIVADPLGHVGIEMRKGLRRARIRIAAIVVASRGRIGQVGHQ